MIVFSIEMFSIERWLSTPMRDVLNRVEGWLSPPTRDVLNRGRTKPDALLHHSDRGSQYTSEQFQKLMADHGVVCSMSRSGNVWDNAAMESFFSSLKSAKNRAKAIHETWPRITTYDFR
jgi:transposase InsO family protein